MPRLSVIVPVYNVQGYLRECLDSVLDQTFTDLELIAVDDASPDLSGSILDAYAERDPRVRVLHLAENRGLGGARNAGLDVAAGEYVLFLDSDDSYAPDSLSEIAGRLDEAAEPDVLIFDYARTYWYGKVRRNIVAHILADVGRDVVTLAERPELLTLLQVVWNKAYRRDFVERYRLRFPSGYYEDTPWTFESLMAARTIAVLDRVCVLYRQRRQGSILHTTSSHHVDLFDQYERVFAFIDAHPELESRRPTIFHRMVDHVITVLDRKDRLPAADREAFFHRGAAAYRRHLPAGLVHPGGLAGVKYELLARDSYPALRAFKAAGTARRRLRRRYRRASHRAHATALRQAYRRELRRPVDPRLAVFSAYWNRGVAGNPKAIAETLAELAPNVHPVWIVRSSRVPTLPPGTDFVTPGSRRYWQVLARAKFLVNNVNFADDVVKRSDQVFLQTHHGTPLKRMGIDQQDYPAAAHGMSFKKLLARCEQWDYSLASNPHSAEVWQRVYPVPFTGLNLGYPCNDRYTTATAADVRAARRSLGILPGTTVLLYAPTHRDYHRGWTPRLDLERLARAAGDRVLILNRGHYYFDYGHEPVEARSGRVLDVSGHPCVEDLCLAADALLTDYSSIMFDYADLDRPIVVYADDWETYVAARGVYFDLTAEPPGAIARSEDELVELFASGAWNDELAAKRRADFRRRFCPWDDGRAAERVVRRVFLGEADLPPLTPLDQRTPAPPAAP